MLRMALPTDLILLGKAVQVAMVTTEFLTSKVGRLPPITDPALCRIF